jgi:hypothetical protein
MATQPAVASFSESRISPVRLLKDSTISSTLVLGSAIDEDEFDRWYFLELNHIKAIYGQRIR